MSTTCDSDKRADCRVKKVQVACLQEMQIQLGTDCLNLDLSKVKNIPYCIHRHHKIQINIRDSGQVYQHKSEFMKKGKKEKYCKSN